MGKFFSGAINKHIDHSHLQWVIYPKVRGHGLSVAPSVPKISTVYFFNLFGSLSSFCYEPAFRAVVQWYFS